MCNADDSDNTASESTYLCEKVGASVQKRGEKEQIVAHKKSCDYFSNGTPLSGATGLGFFFVSGINILVK